MKCPEKIPHATRKQALTARSYRLKAEPSIQLWVYKCPTCHRWHLTSRAPWGRKDAA